MFLRLLLLLTVVPLVELAILLRIAQGIGWQPSLAIVVLTGVVGAWLARREGLKTLARIRADMETGTPPADAVVDGALILIAGVVLVTPGILTDLCGFALLVPAIRRRVKHRLAEALKRRMVVVHQGPEVEFIDVSAVSGDPDNEAEHAQR